MLLPMVISRNLLYITKGLLDLFLVIIEKVLTQSTESNHREKLESIIHALPANNMLKNLKRLYTPMNDRDVSSVIKGYLYLWKHLRKDNAYKICNFILS